MIGIDQRGVGKVVVEEEEEEEEEKDKRVGAGFRSADESPKVKGRLPAQHL